MFFALGQELGHKAIDLKENAKNHFKKTCFNRLSNGDMMYLIDRLQQQKEVRERQADQKVRETRQLDPVAENRRRQAEEANKKMLEKI